MRNARTYLSSAAATLAAAACTPDAPTSPSGLDAPGRMPAESSAHAAPVASALADAVATVDLPDGGVVTFLALGGDEIGIAERTPRGARPAAMPLVARHRATPLEVYLALQPRGTAAPDALVRDHGMRAARSLAASVTPRALATAPSTGAVAGDLDDPGFGDYACDAFGFWLVDWPAAFVGITTYKAAIYDHNLTGNYTFYPGASVYHGTNTNSKTYLGACNGIEYHDMIMEVHRRISGTWVKVLETTIVGYQKYTFYSGLPASYRGRVRPAGMDPVEHYGIGAAWTPSPFLGIAP